MLDRHSSSYHATDSLSPKKFVWALYCRCMLLWNFCNRFHEPSQEEGRAEQAHEAFLEAEAIEDSLNAHRCNLDTTLIYNCQEYIHKYTHYCFCHFINRTVIRSLSIRMLVAQALRRYVSRCERIDIQAQVRQQFPRWFRLRQDNSRSHIQTEAGR